MIYKYNRGITIIELMIVISIIIILSAVAFSSLSRFKKEQSLKNATEDITSLLNKAKSNTLASLNLSNYGVHFESDRAVLFVGNIYNSTDVSNEVVKFDSSVKIPTTGGINIAGGGSNIVFERMTGSALKNGTIVVQLISDTTRQKIITINNVGVISTN